MSREALFRIFAVLFAGAAVYHAVAFFAPASGIGGAHWRHALFIAIDVLCAGFILRRPRWFVWAFGLLTLDTLWSHGSHALKLWRVDGRLDWLSFAVLVVVPWALALLIRDTLDRRSPPMA
jgi:hypothetical protein